ncbi:gibberellin 2-beta-dioxygenase 2 [Salvia hispanica]|uniref:gibberellin 2-beta-dioxygenase 2 n=1 Tax=Salvia hispanica TaxID=49212 RepID=UPI002009A572|nr:gibberellin 2-beta-dioxygenase 2 [Salvia hispanica]
MVPSPAPLRTKKTKAVGVPVIDFSQERSKLTELILRACQDLGFFQVENHGISEEIISRVDSEGRDFFAKTACEKQRAGSPSPFGYGCKNIGFNGDKGELEYLLLEANPVSISRRSNTISSRPNAFSGAVNDYIEAVKKMSSEILEMVAEGLWAQDKSIFSKLIEDGSSDSCFRINHYPSVDPFDDTSKNRIGFGEHSDPQILTVLRSNNVAGLQILSGDGLWIPVPPDSDKLCIFVGDAFQALTNGRFTSVRHRAVANSTKPRMSMMYFAAPPLSASISPIPELVSIQNPSLYRAFTWGEFKSTAYSLRLADNRLHLFTK